MYKRIGVLLVITACSLPCVAADCESLKGEERISCTLKHAIEADGELNKLYRELRAQINEQDRAVLQRIQREWLESRNDECGLFQKETIATDWMATISEHRLACVLRVTSNRLDQLRAYFRRNEFISEEQRKLFELSYIQPPGRANIVANLSLANADGNDPIVSITVSNDRKTMAVGYERGNVLIADLVKGVEIRKFRAHKVRVDPVQFSPSGRLLFTSSHFDTKVKIWSVESGNLVKEFGQESKAIAFSNDGRYWIIGGSSQHGITVYDIYRDVTAFISVGGGTVLSIAVDTSSSRIVVGTSGGSIALYRFMFDLRDGKVGIQLVSEIEPHKPGDWVIGVAFSQDGRKVFSVSRGGEINKWDAATLVRLASFDSKIKNITYAVFDAKRENVLISGFDSEARPTELDLKEGVFRQSTSAQQWPPVATYMGDSDIVIVGPNRKPVLLNRDSFQESRNPTRQ